MMMMFGVLVEEKTKKEMPRKMPYRRSTSIIELNLHLSHIKYYYKSRRKFLVTLLLFLYNNNLITTVQGFSIRGMQTEQANKKLKMSISNPRIIALFDVDGTLTIPRGEVTKEMMEFMKELSKKVTVGIVGGSDLPKQEEQLGEGIVKVFPYNFSQNGLVAYKGGELVEVQTISQHLGEDNVKRIVNWVMKYLSDVDIPVKRGTFFEFRSGMFNISPIGRNCSREERNDYEKYDLEHNIRKNMVEAMKKEFKDLDLTFSIGGQISFDVFPTGWDKTYCLKFLPESDYDEIHFFGDKTFEGGNDYEIFSHSRTIGHTVTSPDDTKEQCTKLFMS